MQIYIKYVKKTNYPLFFFINAMRKNKKYKNKIPKHKIYKIILTNHGNEIKRLCSDTTETKITKKFNEMLKENKKTIFPKQFSSINHKLVDADYEIVIIKAKKEGDEEETKIKDSYGKFITYKSSNSDWIVINRAEYYMEETFWVYGYHPMLQRKDFTWIFENFIEKDAKDKMKFKTVQVYLNKVLIECGGKFEMVLCKNRKDAIRMHNLMQEWCNKKKYKYVAFMGDLDKSKYKSDWIKRIMELTNWSWQKATRVSTRE